MLRRAFLLRLAFLLAAFTPVARVAVADDPARLRVLTYNIHHGEGLDGKLDLERIARVIESVAPDVVALQEVDRNTSRSGSVDQPKELGRLTGLESLFEGNIKLDGGEYGNAVLTRLPVKRHRNHPLPRFDDGEQRGLLEVEILWPSETDTLRFLATHLDHRKPDGERLASARVIETLLHARPDGPTVLAGDLNAQPDSSVLEHFRTTWTSAAAGEGPFTFPADAPTRLIDYVLYNPADRWKVIEHRVLDEPAASDHRPVLVVLELAGE